MSSKLRNLYDFLALLKRVEQHGDQYQALCPGHNDKKASLSIKEAEGKILLKCHAGCDLSTILKPLNLEPKDLFLNNQKTETKPEHCEIEAIYHYEGFEVVRTKPKGFYQRRPDGKGGYINNLKGVVPSLYHQSELTQVISAGETIFIVEGEKDVDQLRNKGFSATCNPMGAGKWRENYSDALQGADLVIIPDNDQTGHDHSAQVARSCCGKAARIRILELPGDSKDVSDWLIKGGVPDQLKQLASQCSDYEPPNQEESLSDISLVAPAELPETAWQGLFKDYRDLVGETTEASDAFHYATFCQVLGCTLGRRIYVYHATRLYPNFFICLVGRSGLTRKDTCWVRAGDILDRLHTYESDSEETPPFRIIKGIRSYEGLLDELAGERKVRLIQIGELLSLLAKAKQESLGNIVPQLAELYDCPSLVNPPVHQKITHCQEPFVSIMAGTTQAWLQRALTERDIYGGFANRWLYFVGLPKEPKPNPPKVDKEGRDAVIETINTIRMLADNLQDGEITISEEAGTLFSTYYKNFYRRCQQEGLVPTLIQRVQDYVWKLALLYAAMDLSETILRSHLEPAIAVADYLEASVAEVFASFGESKGRQVETRVLLYLQGAGGPIPYRDVYRNLNLSGKELETAIEPLLKVGMIKNHYEGKKRMLKVV